jgi:hypothetical protein
MRNNYLRKFITAVGFFCIFQGNVAAQPFIISTWEPDSITGQGYDDPAIITFNIENTNDTPYVLTKIEMMFNQGFLYSGTVAKLWYSETSLYGQTNDLSETGGWNVITTGDPVSMAWWDYYSLFQNLSFTIPPHTQYRFGVESSKGFHWQQAVYLSADSNTYLANGIYFRVGNATLTPMGVDTVGYVGVVPYLDSDGGQFFFGRITLEPATTTPVTLLNLTATYNNKDANIINWQTSQEINSRSFTLQKAYTPPFFSNVTTLPAAGNSSTIQNYTYTDNSIEYRTTYYRLLQTDKDGKSSYSKTVSVTPTAKSFAISNLYPSPAQSTITIEYNSPARAATALTVTDMLGRPVQKQTLQTAAGFNKQAVNVSRLPKGKYIVVLNNGTEQVQKGFVKEQYQ